jgi:CheY-like chemotaxis protein
MPFSAWFVGRFRDAPEGFLSRTGRIFAKCDLRAEEAIARPPASCRRPWRSRNAEPRWRVANHTVAREPDGPPPNFAFGRRAAARENARLSADGLSGLRVLLAEDEPHVQMLIEDFLVGLGCKVQAVSTFDAALRAAREADVDVAVLDVNLNGQQSFPAAEALAERHIPFVLSTGYASQGIQAAWKDRPWLQKPFIIEQLTQALRTALKSRGAAR